MSGWVLLACVLMGAFMAWRDRYLSARKPPAIPSYVAGVLGVLGGAYGGHVDIHRHADSVRENISYRPLATADRFDQHHADHQEPAKHGKFLSNVRQVASPHVLG